LIFSVNALTNFILQRWLGPTHVACKLTMISLVLVVLLMLFGIMRIFGALTPIVIMLTRVLSDLRAFLTFFAIIIFKFGLVLSVLGVGNVKVDGKFRDKFKDFDIDDPFDMCGNTMPGIEYHHIG
jgi:hypothetical protein